MDVDVNIIEAVEHAFHLYDDLQPNPSRESGSDVDGEGEQNHENFQEMAVDDVAEEDIDSDIPDHSTEPS
jgi:hypothetical protein